MALTKRTLFCCTNYPPDIFPTTPEIVIVPPVISYTALDKNVFFSFSNLLPSANINQSNYICIHFLFIF